MDRSAKSAQHIAGPLRPCTTVRRLGQGWPTTPSPSSSGSRFGGGAKQCRSTANGVLLLLGTTNGSTPTVSGATAASRQKQAASAPLRSLIISIRVFFCGRDDQHEPSRPVLLRQRGSLARSILLAVIMGQLCLLCPALRGSGSEQ